jgi:two-component system NarL family sensor kinase
VRLLRNPVVQYLTLAVLLFIVLSVVTSIFSARVAADEASADARALTRVLARSVAQPAIPRGLIDGDAGAIDKLDREVLERLLVGDVRRVKIWRQDGTILYSDETRLIGAQYPLDEEESRVLDGGGTEAEVSDLSKPENRYESSSDGLVEVYTRIRSPEGEPMLFEVYFSADDLAARRTAVLAPFQRITIGGLLAMLVVATPIIWVLTRRLTRNARERERLLRASMTASEAERRRIARDLHDGVVQDLAGTAFVLSGAVSSAESAGQIPLATSLRRASEAVRSSIGGLRSLLVEIYPPSLNATGLDAVLLDLVEGPTTRGLEVELELPEATRTRLDRDGERLVFRVAQECLRNVARHAQARHVAVRLTDSGGSLVLSVTDDGVGFAPDRVLQNPRPEQYGLRLMVDDARAAAADLRVRSAPGRGTQWELEVVGR